MVIAAVGTRSKIYSIVISLSKNLHLAADSDSSVKNLGNRN